MNRIRPVSQSKVQSMFDSVLFTTLHEVKLGVAGYNCSSLCMKLGQSHLFDYVNLDGKLPEVMFCFMMLI